MSEPLSHQVPATAGRRESITAQSLRSLALRLGLLICATSGLAYWHLHDALVAKTVAQLEAYIEQRGIRESLPFQLAEANLESMAEELRAALRDPPVDGRAVFDARWEKRADGTWRHRSAGHDLSRDPTLFHGRHVPLTDALKARVGLFTHLATQWGRAYRRQFTDTYISAPTNTLVMTWPGVDWGGTAAADFDIRQEEYFTVADPQSNPERKTVWTGVYYDKVAAVWMVSVEKPVDVDGEWVATIGHDVTLDELIRRALNDCMPGTKNILMRSDGRLISHPDHMDEILASGGSLRVDDLGPRARDLLDRALAATETRRKVFETSDGDAFVAVHRLAGSGWVFLVEYPDALINAEARSDAEVVFGLGLCSLVAELAVLFVVFRRKIAQPLQSLTKITERVAAGDFGVQIAIDRHDEFGQLARSFNAMTQVVAERDARLAEHAAQLEVAVATRTNELRQRNGALRMVLDNVREGLVTIDLLGHMTSERSRAMSAWFGNDSAATLPALLATKDAVVGACFAAGLEQLADGNLPAEVALAQLPRRMTVGATTLAIDSQPILEAGSVTSILVIFTDITAELARRKAEAEQRMLLRVIDSVGADRAGFEGFVNEADSLVQRLAEGGLTVQGQHRALHTLKGNAAIFGLTAIAEECQSLELELGPREALNSEQRSKLQRSWQQVRDRVRGLLGAVGQDQVLVKRSEVLAAIDAAHRGVASAQLAPQLEAWLLDSVDARLGRLAETARLTAVRLGKTGLRVETPPCGLRLDGATWGPFWAACVHLVRNAVDHGIEAPAERRRAGKPVEGRVALSASVTAEEFVVTVADDGAGIDWDTVARLARARGLPFATEQHRIAALFADGLSTKSRATDISGRGVGLAAVRAEVERLGGRIQVESTRGVGTRVSMRWPQAAMVPTAQLAGA